MHRMLLDRLGDGWESDPGFEALLPKVRSFSVIEPRRLFTLFILAQEALRLEGAIVEVGVYKGGSAKLLVEVVGPKRDIHLFDTFTGIPVSNQQYDRHKIGDFGDTNLEQVREFISGGPNVKYWPGVFPKTAEPLRHDLFSFVHVDVDVYQSVKDCCEFFYPKLTAGGIMVFDDYGSQACPGVAAALSDFFADEYDCPMNLGIGQAVMVEGQAVIGGV